MSTSRHTYKDDEQRLGLRTKVPCSHNHGYNNDPDPRQTFSAEVISEHRKPHYLLPLVKGKV